MSTDYDVACHTCRTYAHLGQRFTSGWAFGFGSNDRAGQLAVGAYVVLHGAHDLRVHESEETPADFAED